MSIKLSEYDLRNIFSKKYSYAHYTSDFELLSYELKKKRNLQPRSAAVLIPIFLSTNEPQVILTKRTQTLSTHPGQIAFPGGLVEKFDISEEATALRETFEEIALHKSNIEIIGSLPKHETVTGFLITPFVGLTKGNLNFSANPSEVEEIFKVPLDFLINRKNMFIHKRLMNKVERSYYAIPYGPYYIWGATARIIKTLSERVGD